MQRNFMERRRKEPSYIVPIFFFCLEVAIMYLFISLLNWDINPSGWNVYSYIVTSIWFMYICMKFYHVLKRQKKIF